MSSTSLKIAIKMGEINFQHKRNGIKMPEGQTFKKIIKYFSCRPFSRVSMLKHWSRLSIATEDLYSWTVLG